MWLFLSRRLRAWIVLAVALPVARSAVRRLSTAATRKNPEAASAKVLRRADTLLSRADTRRRGFGRFSAKKAKPWVALTQPQGRASESTTPGADPDLNETDPGFVAYFNAWLRDEVDADSGLLDGRTRQLVRIASVIASNGLARFRVLAEAALDIGLTPVELKEVVYQAVVYVGYATASDFLKATNDVLRGRGVELPLPDQSTTDPATRLERGRAVEAQIVGEATVDEMYASAPGDEQHIQRYLSGNAFGDVVGRGGLDLRTRELVTFSMLAALGGADVQLRAHVQGNLSVGNDRARMLAVLTALIPAIGYPRSLNALAALNAVTR